VQKLLQEGMPPTRNPARTWALDRAAGAYPTPQAQSLSRLFAVLLGQLGKWGRGGGGAPFTVSVLEHSSSCNLSVENILSQNHYPPPSPPPATTPQLGCWDSNLY